MSEHFNRIQVWPIGGDDGDHRPAIEVGREPRYVLRAARSKPTIDVEAVEVGPSTACRGHPAALRLRW